MIEVIAPDTESDPNRTVFDITSIQPGVSEQDRFPQDGRDLVNIDDLTIDEILTDPLIAILMLVDHVEPQVFDAMLQSAAAKRACRLVAADRTADGVE